MYPSLSPSAAYWYARSTQASNSDRNVPAADTETRHSSDGMLP